MVSFLVSRQKLEVPSGDLVRFSAVFRIRKLCIRSRVVMLGVILMVWDRVPRVSIRGIRVAVAILILRVFHSSPWSRDFVILVDIRVT